MSTSIRDQSSSAADAPLATVAQAHNTGEWAAYLASKRGVTPYAAFAWGEILQTCYGAEPVRFMAKGPRGVCGVMLGYVPRRARGHRTLYSAPIVADDSAVTRTLLDAAHAFSASNGIARSVIAAGDIAPDTPYRQWSRTTVVKPLPAREEEAWQGLRKKTRYTIRRATASGIAVERGPERSAEFYAAYRARMSEKNVPFHGFSYFNRMSDILGDKIEWLVAVKEGRVLGGMTFALGNDAAVYQLNAAYSDAMPLGVNHLLMWEAMRGLIGRGISHLDLGESTPGGGVFAFKTVQFGGIAQDVSYCDVMRGPGASAMKQQAVPLFHQLAGLFMRTAPASWRSRWLLSQTPYGRLL